MIVYNWLASTVATMQKLSGGYSYCGLENSIAITTVLV